MCDYVNYEDVKEQYKDFLDIVGKAVEYTFAENNIGVVYDNDNYKFIIDDGGIEKEVPLCLTYSKENKKYYLYLDYNSEDVSKQIDEVFRFVFDALGKIIEKLHKDFSIILAKKKDDVSIKEVIDCITDFLVKQFGS